MRIGIYGIEKMEAEEAVRVLNEVKEKYSKYVLEFVEGIYNKKQSNTILKKWCEENKVKLTQILPDWSDLSDFEGIPPTNRFGQPYNPNAANRRDQYMAEYLKKHQKNMMLVYRETKDKYGNYMAWCTNNQDIPTYITNLDTGNVSSNIA